MFQEQEIGPPGGPGAPGRQARLHVHSDVAIAAGIIAFCAVVYAITLTFPEMPAILTMGMGPAVFPRLLLGVMVVLTVVLVWSAGGRADEVRAPVPPIVYLTASGFFAYMAAAWLIGLLPAGFLAILGFGLLWGERRWLMLLASAAFLCALIYLVFVKGFAIPLPRGLVGDWLF